MATITLVERILEFFNTVNDPYEIRYRIKDDPNFGSAPASGYGITLDTAQRILDRRSALGGAFSEFRQIDNVRGVGPDTLHNILYSFSGSLCGWTASDDEQEVTTLKKVGIGTENPRTRAHVRGSQLSSFWGRSEGILRIDGEYKVGHYEAIDFSYNEGSHATARIAAYHDAGGSRLVFGTSDNYSAGITNAAVTISPQGRVGIGVTNPGGKLHVHAASGGQDAHGLVLTRDGGGPHLHFVEYGRVASIQWHKNYLLVSSGTGTNIDRILLYGNVYATGRSGASCDYAEYFESTSGKTIPAGTAVGLEDGKIRPAKKNEHPIGVISANPGLVGGAHIEWPKKYLRDEFGAPIMEEYQAEITVPKKNEDGTDALDENGQYIMLGTGEFETRKRSKLNPEYDEGQEYIPREQRPEWNCVALLGQLPLRKGQPVAESWVKIKDTSDEIELWLVK